MSSSSSWLLNSLLLIEQHFKLNCLVAYIRLFLILSNVRFFPSLFDQENKHAYLLDDRKRRKLRQGRQHWKSVYSCWLSSWFQSSVLSCFVNLNGNKWKLHCFSFVLCSHFVKKHCSDSVLKRNEEEWWKKSAAVISLGNRMNAGAIMDLYYEWHLIILSKLEASAICKNFQISREL